MADFPGFGRFDDPHEFVGDGTPSVALAFAQHGCELLPVELGRRELCKVGPRKRIDCVDAGAPFDELGPELAAQEEGATVERDGLQALTLEVGERLREQLLELGSSGLQLGVELNLALEQILVAVQGPDVRRSFRLACFHVPPGVIRVRPQ